MTNPSSSSSKNQASTGYEPPHPSTVGNSFVKQYYHLLAKSPETLHRFYKDDSKFTHGYGSQQEEAISGQKNINDKIMAMGYAGARVDLESGSVDCQASLNGGVSVMVAGIITLKDHEPRAFVQCFFLAVQPNGYFVLNDVFRYLDTPKHLSLLSSLDQGITKSDIPSFPSKISSPRKLEKSPEKGVSQKTDPKPDKSNEADIAQVPECDEPKDLVAESISKSNDQVEKQQKKTDKGIVEKKEVNDTPSANGNATEPQKPKSWASHLFSNSAPLVSASPSKTPHKPQPNRTSTVGSSQPQGDVNAGGQEFGSHQRVRFASLYIRDLPAQTTEIELRELFQPYGTVLNVNILSPVRGIAFIDYSHPDAVRVALADGRQFRIHDKLIHVEERHAEKKGDGNRGYRSDRAAGRGGRGSRNRGARGEKDRGSAPGGKDRRDKGSGKRSGRPDTASGRGSRV